MAESSSADYVLLDSGAGTGRAFDWQWVRRIFQAAAVLKGMIPDRRQRRREYDTAQACVIDQRAVVQLGDAFRDHQLFQPFITPDCCVIQLSESGGQLQFPEHGAVADRFIAKIRSP